jgi:branched-chain amino acid transport system ATP-binding protein
MSLLVAQDLCKAFDGVVAARDVSFTVAAGELVAIIGPNGAGKSTTFNMIGGQLVPDSGSVVFDGQPITGLPSRAIWRRGVGRTFQVAQTFVSMSVTENVQMALISARRETRALWKPAPSFHREDALRLLDSVGMRADADKPVSALSYGDVKRIELAIAIASEPKLLLMDEPTAGMAPRERAALMQLVATIARERRIGILFTEHDMDAVFSHADRVLVLVRGVIIAAGSPDEVRADARVRQVYLGESGITAALRTRRKAAAHA